MQWLSWVFPGALTPPPPEQAESAQSSRDAITRANDLVDRVARLLEQEAALERRRLRGDNAT